MNLPTAFTEKMRALFERQFMVSEWDAFLACFAQSAARAFRMNELKLDDMAKWRFLAKEIAVAQGIPEDFAVADAAIPWSRDGLYLPDSLQPAKSVAYRAGLFYIQEASAMLPAEILDVQPGQAVLDLCAAPGGKSARLAARMRGKGLLWTNDVSVDRARALLRNLEMLGCPCATVTAALPDALAAQMPAFFDRVLVDAPCSGEGMFRRDPQAIRAWENRSLDRITALQSQILDAAADLLAAGGELLYSTCTFEPAENEEQIAAFLCRHPDFSLLDAADRLPKAGACSRGLRLRGESARLLHERRGLGDDALEKALRIWPQRQRGDGHFCCLLRKAEGAASGLQSRFKRAPEVYPRKTRRLSAASGAIDAGEAAECLHALLSNLLTPEALGRLADIPPERYRLEENRLHILSDPAPILALSAVKYLKTGNFVATFRRVKQGLVCRPTHSFLLTLTEEDIGRALRLEPEDKRVLAYLRGETLHLTAEEQAALGLSTWLPLLWAGYPLGWCKIQGETAKNLYPPGWIS